ncbi:LOW QUALITY PROTEIN: coiled-coil domain-containing protein 78 [Menidia menidia]
MREEYEEDTFELKDKRDRLSGELLSTGARLRKEESGQGLAEEYNELKKNYCVLAEAHDEELALSDELSAELLALARAQDAIPKQLKEQQRINATTQDLHRELDSHALMSCMAHINVQPEDVAELDEEQKKNAQKTVSVLSPSLSPEAFYSSSRAQLLGNQNEIKDILKKMRSGYVEQQRKLEEKMVATGKEHQENREIHIGQTKESARRTVLMCCQSQVQELEIENSKLQLRVKDIKKEAQREQVLAKPENGLDPGPPEALFALESGETESGETEKEPDEVCCRQLRSR